MKYRARQSTTDKTAALGARLIDALRLSRASGAAVKNLAGDEVEKQAATVQFWRPKRRGGKSHQILRPRAHYIIWCAIVHA